MKPLMKSGRAADLNPIEVADDDLARSPRSRPLKKSNSEVAAYFEPNVGDDT